MALKKKKKKVLIVIIITHHCIEILHNTKMCALYEVFFYLAKNDEDFSCNCELT